MGSPTWGTGTFVIPQYSSSVPRNLLALAGMSTKSRLPLLKGGIMLAFVRRPLLLSLVALLVACSGTTGSTTPIAAGVSGDGVNAALDSAPEVAAGHAIVRKLSIHPNAKLPAILMNFVSNGPDQGGVPCIACVNGAQSKDNIGLTGPSSYVPTGATWQYALSFTDLTFKGKCKLAWAITSGKKVIDSFSATLNLTSSGGFVLYALNRGRPAYSGPAVLTGKVTCGTSSQSTQAPLESQ
jgi:hypothetical protein